jgi:hypothetical protein
LKLKTERLKAHNADRKLGPHRKLWQTYDEGVFARERKNALIFTPNFSDANLYQLETINNQPIKSAEISKKTLKIMPS